MTEVNKNGVCVQVRTKDKLTVSIRRGGESWAYLYVALGFTLSLGGTVIQLIGLRSSYALLLFTAFAASAAWLFLANGWFQSKLLGWKIRYENKPR